MLSANCRAVILLPPVLIPAPYSSRGLGIICSKKFFRSLCGKRFPWSNSSSNSKHSPMFPLVKNARLAVYSYWIGQTRFPLILYFLIVALMFSSCSHDTYHSQPKTFWSQWRHERGFVWERCFSRRDLRLNIWPGVLHPDLDPTCLLAVIFAARCSSLFKRTFGMGLMKWLIAVAIQSSVMIYSVGRCHDQRCFPRCLSLGCRPDIVAECCRLICDEIIPRLH